MISRSWTLFYKILFPLVWVGTAGTWLIFLFLDWIGYHGRGFQAPPLDFGLIFSTGLIIAFGAYFYWYCARLKRVAMDDSYLYISNYLKEIMVPLQEVVDIREDKWARAHFITLVFKDKTEFGSKVIFIPQVEYNSLADRVYKSFPYSHPIVEALWGAIQRANKRAVEGDEKPVPSGLEPR